MRHHEANVQVALVLGLREEVERALLHVRRRPREVQGLRVRVVEFRDQHLANLVGRGLVRVEREGRTRRKLQPVDEERVHAGLMQLRSLEEFVLAQQVQQLGKVTSWRPQREVVYGVAAVHARKARCANVHQAHVVGPSNQLLHHASPKTVRIHHVLHHAEPLRRAALGARKRLSHDILTHRSTPALREERRPFEHELAFESLVPRVHGEVRGISKLSAARRSSMSAEFNRSEHAARDGRTLSGAARSARARRLPPTRAATTQSGPP